MRRLFALGVLIGTLNILPSHAMELSIIPDPETVFIVAGGRIVSGDAERFRLAVRSQPGKQVILTISSIGGNVFEASKLAELVSGWRIPVLASKVCVSACFLVFAASPSRFATRTSQIGVHSAGTDHGENIGTMAATTAMAREAAQYGVPQSIIGRMVTTGADEVAWLNASDLRAMRVTYIEDLPGPSSAPPAPVAPPPVASLPVSPLTAPTPSFSQGYADRASWELWVAQQSGSYRQGADYWASQRSLPKPGSCATGDPTFSAGCNEAQRRLSLSDVRRKADPEYRRGWNSH